MIQRKNFVSNGTMRKDNWNENMEGFNFWKEIITWKPGGADTGVVDRFGKSEVVERIGLWSGISEAGLWISLELVVGRMGPETSLWPEICRWFAVGVGGRLCSTSIALLANSSGVFKSLTVGARGPATTVLRSWPVALRASFARGLLGWLEIEPGSGT